MANCTQNVSARDNHSDLICANGDLESFDVLIHKENQKYDKKSILSIFFTYICEKKIFFWGQKIRKNRFFLNCSKSHIYVYSRSKTCLGTSKGHFLAIYTYISHYLPLCEKSNFWKNRDFSEFWWFFNKSKFGRLAGRKWPKSWFMLKNIFLRHFRSLFI